MRIRPDRQAIDNRDELAFAIAEAAEMEHTLVCLYLFAGFALKTHADEGGVSAAQLEMTREWKRTMMLIARQEMEHLGYACNLLTAIGASPHLRLPPFPIDSRFFGRRTDTADAADRELLELRPLDETALRRFIDLERPAEIPLERLLTRRATAYDVAGPTPMMDELIRPVEYETIGELYEKIRDAFERLDPATLFIGPAAAQVSTVELGLGDRGFYDIFVRPIGDRDAALQAIDQIVEEGEGTGSRGAHELEGTHVGRLQTIYFELLDERDESAQRGEPFEPSRPVLHNPIDYDWGGNPRATLVQRRTTRRALELFNYAYQTMLLMLQRFYVHDDRDSAEQTASLKETAFWPLMTMTIRPLGELLTQLPATADPGGPTAGPSFHVLRNHGLLPNRASTWVVFRERLGRMASFAGELTAELEPELPPALHERFLLVARDLKRIETNFSGASRTLGTE